ncbi:MAG TPA: GRP family sugar transporter [Candidatus Limnocylindrales bacterium]
MDPVALAAISLAAVLHAAWNILLKTAGDPLRMATAGVIAASAILVPLVAAGWFLARPSIPVGAWVVGIVSGAIEVAYFVFLAAAFRRGDLSVVYPLARGFAPLLAVGIGVLVLGERLSPGAWIGVGLLLAGLLVVQRPWRLVRTAAARDDRLAAGFALLTGAMIATYSALDRVGVQLAPAWFYAGILWPVCAIGLAAVAWVRPRMAGGRYAAGDEPLDRPRAIVGGLLTFSAYGLVLAALSRAALAIVAPLRESAVVLASAWGVVRLGEAADRREVAFRLAGSALVLVGAVALAIAR